MDEQLKALLEFEDISAGVTTLETQIRFIDAETGELELLRGEDDPTPRRHRLKPLSELYGQGKSDASVDPQSEDYMPLFLAIEQEFVRCYRLNPSLTDGIVGLALDLLAMNPEGNVQHDSLARCIQLELRLLLSLNDYSREEVRQALRKVRKSVDRHTHRDGRRGYLDFLCDHLPA